LRHALHGRLHHRGCDGGRAQVTAALADPAQAALEGGRLAQERAESGDRVHPGLGHRAVRHAPVRGHARPHDPALLQAQLVLLRLADDGRRQLAAERALGQMPGADHVALLVHERAYHQAAGQPCIRALERGGGDHRGGQTALHVRGAAPVDPSVQQLGAEGVV
jgi:hypothetical protein